MSVSTGSLSKSDLYSIYGIVQNTMLGFSKSIVSEVLKESFSQDSFYHYVEDDFGFAQVTDLTGKDLKVGLHDDASTRIFIGEPYRYDQKYFPAILIKGGSFKSVPISFNQNKELVQYKSVRYTDGYGNVKIFSTPEYFDMAGAWEGEVNVEIVAGDMSARDELVSLVAILLETVHQEQLIKSGCFFKPLSISSPTETDDSKDKLYRQVISLPVRTEWRRRIPIESILQRINFCVSFGNLAANIFAPAINLAINNVVELTDVI